MLIMLFLLIQGYNITTNAYNAVTPRTTNTIITNIKILIRRQYSNTYNIIIFINSRILIIRCKNTIIINIYNITITSNTTTTIYIMMLIMQDLKILI